MLDSVKTPFNECIEQLKKAVKLDPYFVEFYEWAKANNVPIVVLSSGMIPIISALLENLLGHKPEDLHIVANDVVSRDGKDINSEAGWEIQFHDDRYICSQVLQCKDHQELIRLSQSFRPRQVLGDQAVRCAAHRRTPYPAVCR